MSIFRKFFLTLVFLGLGDLFIISCCDDAQTFNTEITNFHVASTKLQNELPASAIVSKDKFRINFQIETAIEVAANLFTFSHSALAFSCPYDIITLGSKITDFALSCDKRIFDTDSGVAIDPSLIRVYRSEYSDDSENTRMTLAEWLSLINDVDYGDNIWFFEFTNEIQSLEYLVFTIEFKQASGKVFTANTYPVKLE